jgi:glycoprotein endo-alpha-1,2-mannosidase
MRWRPFTAVVLLGLLCVPVPSVGAEPGVQVTAFYYPWYGNPGHDGGYRHWQQGGMRLPGQLASAFYPVRGLYSSADSLVLGAQAAEIRTAGIDVLVSSWWGRGSFEDERLESIQLAADRVGLQVAVHLEPYSDRTPESTRADVEYLLARGIGDFYLYGAHERPASEWHVVTEVDGARIFAQTTMAGYAAAGGFDGLYTYDVLVHNGAAFARICASAHARNLLCAPSVGPGYHARRAVGDPRVRPRRAGRTYDAMWRNAIAAAADSVSITSYNEWHEGTQIEPARPYVGPKGGRYYGYDGAYGKTGRAAETAYLDRTAYWSARFRTAASRAGAGNGR